MATRKFTVAQLWELGMRGDDFSDSWLPYDDRETSTSVVDIRDAEPRKAYHAVEVVFSYENALWRVRIEYPRNDWFSNNLVMPVEHRNHYVLVAEQVEAREVQRTVYEPVP